MPWASNGDARRRERTTIAIGNGGGVGALAKAGGHAVSLRQRIVPQVAVRCGTTSRCYHCHTIAHTVTLNVGGVGGGRQLGWLGDGKGVDRVARRTIGNGYGVIASNEAVLVAPLPPVFHA